MTRRKSVRRGLPGRFLSGISGAISAYSASRRSFEYSRSSLRYCARVISVQAILISSGSRKPMNHNLLKSLNSFSGRH